MSRQTGYIQDVPYPHHYQRESTPLWLSFITAALGIQGPDITRPYSWCELGCGQGFGAVINAATNPLGQFTAIDFNPQHIAHGRDLAQAAGLDNLAFIEADFSSLIQIAREQGPQHDFIVLNGVYSWISASDRQALHQCIEHWLKPGGILFLGYMCQPGMAFLAGAQRFLRCHAEHAAGDAVQQLLAGMAMLERMEQGGAGFFQHYPLAGQYLRLGKTQDPRYLVHELLNEHWESLHVADVIASMAACGCDYIGTATPLENIDALSLPGNLLPILDALHTPAERETFKDLARNQSERRDLYQKGIRRLDNEAHRQVLLDQVVSVLPGAPSNGGLTFDTRIGPVQGDASLFGPLLESLATGPCAFAELLRLPALQAQASLINPALQMLAWAGYLHPLLPGEVALERCRVLNRVIAGRAMRGESYAHLAAPTLGSALGAEPLHMVAMRVVLEYPEIGGRLLRETILAVLRDNGIAAGDDLQARLDAFVRITLPAWQQMGIVEIQRCE